MQTLIVTDQESGQSQASMKPSGGMLFLGILVALLFMFFDWRNQSQALDEQSEQAGGWRRTLWVLLLIGLTIFVLINLITGP